MKSFFALVNKEFKSYFNSPIAYIAIFLFLIFPIAMFFYFPGSGFIGSEIASMGSFFFWMQFSFIIIIPAVTMKSWAEERKARTDEVLATLPYSETQLVGAKFIGSFSLMLISLALTLIVPITISVLGDFDGGQIFSQYVGLLLLAALSVSTGLFVSSFCKNQITAFLITLMILGSQMIIFLIIKYMKMPFFLNELFGIFSYFSHFDSFNKGLLDTKDIAYFGVLTLFFMYLNTKILIFRKWR